MNLIKYNFYFFILLFFFSITPKNIYPWELGTKLGFTFQSFYTDSGGNAIEQSGFGENASLFALFLPHPRFLLLTEAGFSYHGSFYTPYIGLTMAFVIYPDYLPFIGLSLKEHYYNQVKEKTNVFNTSLYFSAGSKIFYSEFHSVWIFFDYLVFQSLYKKYNSSRIDINFAYSYSFQE